MKKLKKLKDNLIAAIKKAHKEHVIKEYFKNNKLFVTYVLTCVINSTLIRFFTINTLENYLSFKAILADLTIVVLLGSFSYFFKPKNRYNYLMFLEIIFTIICTANSVYYTFYTSFASVSMLSLTQYIGQVGDAVVHNVFQLKDL